VTGRARAAAGSLAFLVVAPGVVAGLVPWLLTGWDANEASRAAVVVGWLLIGSGTAVLLSAFARFVFEGSARLRRSHRRSGSSSEASIATCATRCTSRSPP